MIMFLIKSYTRTGCRKFICQYVKCNTKVIVLQEAEVANVFPHGDFFYSALVQGELLGNIYVTV